VTRGSEIGRALYYTGSSQFVYSSGDWNKYSRQIAYVYGARPALFSQHREVMGPRGWMQDRGPSDWL